MIICVDAYVMLKFDETVGVFIQSNPLPINV